MKDEGYLFMRLYDCKTNHITNPLGYYIGHPTLTWKVGDTESIQQEYGIVSIAMDTTMQNVIFDSGKLKNVCGCGYEVPLICEPMTRYYWQVTICGDSDEATSEVNWFETGKGRLEWQAVWITPEKELSTHPVMAQQIKISKQLVKARAYVCGLGLYEIQIAGVRVGKEYFNPHYTAYDKWIQYQTFDVLSYLQQGENIIDITLGNGWYKGGYGLNGRKNLYGDEFALLFEMHLYYSDGTSQVICTDENWIAKPSNITESGIYYGEDVDARIAGSQIPVKRLAMGYERLQEMRSLPVVITKELKPDIIVCSNGERILDFKQNMVGFIRCVIEEPEGTQIKIRFGEVLQEGNFYSENYRTARSEFNYISNGQKCIVTPKFTSFGFRYAKISGVKHLKAEHFIGCVLHSDLQETGKIICSNEKINQLINNTKWSIRGNSLDLPTDCPQRDERLGWTGDCQAISSTAMMFFDMHAFYSKWLYELQYAQDGEGCVPDVVPRADYDGKGACAWSDAAAIVPYQMYLVYGDKGILKQQYKSMKAWVDYITNKETDGNGLRRGDFGRHYGDWLALDHPNGKTDPDFAEGYTDKTYLASVYYAYSAKIVSDTAKILGNEEDYRTYAELSKKVKEAIYNILLKEGKPETSTQTAYILALSFELIPPNKREEYVGLLKERLKLDNYKLLTGFIGTIFALQVLCENGMKELAYQMFLSEEYPGWLYAVNLGATTIWERWNSLMPDGSANKGGMNSFNHYAYGMVIGWMFQYSAGIKPDWENPGYKEVEIKPYPDERLPVVYAEIDSPMGKYSSAYEYRADRITYTFEIPFNCSAKIILQNLTVEEFTTEEVKKYSIRQENKNIVMIAHTGKHKISQYK